MDFPYVTRVNVASLAALASAPASPSGSEIIATEFTNDTPLWQHSVRVGNRTSFTLHLSKDNFFFGVRAVDKQVNRSPVSFPSPFFG